MKRLTVLFLIVLLLAGCAGRDPYNETQEQDFSTSTEKPGLYDPDSEAERQTGGAVRAYPLDAGEYRWLSTMGDGLLLGTDGANMTLTALSGDNCAVDATVTLPEEAAAPQAAKQGAVYYSESDKAVVYLSLTLMERNRVALPADARGAPVADKDAEEIFYCTANEIRGLNPGTGISRLIKRQECKTQSLVAAYFCGKVLACQVTDADNRDRVVYVDTQTGETLYTAEELLSLDTYENMFYVTRLDGVVRQNIFGTLDAVGGQFALESVIPALALNGVLTIDMDDALHLTFYTLSDGEKTASVELPGVSEPEAVLSDGRNSCVWFLAHELSSGRQVLYRWSIADSPVFEDSVYTGVLITAKQPDTDALSQCQKRVDAFNKKHGVDIRIWEDAVAEPGEYTLSAEYQSAPINALLDDLEAIFPLFPEGFLQKSAGGKLHICLVREVAQQETGVQYWSGGEPYIVLTSGCDGKKEFLDRIGYVIDTYVLGNSVSYDSWNQLNPAKFAYDYDYAVSDARTDDQYLEGSSRAFIDKRSMSYPTEDRCRIFACAVSQNCEGYFSSKTMQSKLACLCRGIRQAFDLETDPGVFVWEQYLENPLAPPEP